MIEGDQVGGGVRLRPTEGRGGPTGSLSKPPRKFLGLRVFYGVSEPPPWVRSPKL